METFDTNDEQKSEKLTSTFQTSTGITNAKATQDGNLNSNRPITQKRKKTAQPLQENVAPNKRHKSQKILNPSSKCDQIGHFPVIDKSRRVRCKNCGKKSYIFCPKCAVHLCMSIPGARNCFKDFHCIETNTQENVNLTEKNKMEKMPDSRRFDQTGHFPVIDKSRQVRCKNEKCDKKSYILCIKCNVHLCLNTHDSRNCFTEFHSISNGID